MTQRRLLPETSGEGTIISDLRLLKAAVGNANKFTQEGGQIRIVLSSVIERCLPL
jgi:hypothetical protein